MTARYDSDNSTAAAPCQTPWATLAGVMCLAAALLLPAPAQAGLVNGDFSAGLSGWQLRGPVTDGGGDAVLAEHPTEIMTTLSQEFVIPPGAESLAFEFRLASEPDSTSGSPFPDAFAVSLLDPVTFVPLLSSPGVPDYFHVDVGGATEYDPALVNVVGDTVTLDLSSLGPADTFLAFDLLGGDNGLATTVEVDNVVLSERQGFIIPEPATILGISFALASACGYLRRRQRP